MSAVDNYLAALQRLIEGRPKNVPKGSAINKDTVALEAGRKRGSIKKSRAENADLIAEIEAAAAAQREASKPSASEDVQKQKALKQAAKEQLGDLKADYELALQKIVSLAQENYLLKQQISELTAEKHRGKFVPLGNHH
ncbi:hypothetical protein MHM84_20205 [Halomonas sp. McH1-25]|uniref:hypothetical protein n=1 Tax=unclassified Halomonas TaxID=2609666 RepID=UPI001EF4B1AB|nr:MULTISPECIES: hypothetical protein [unclassified Halomonas]MCG7602069.1 hypothetical protein [Halomonas sp. McH1-25]MCP1342905.1 hypothetical protein [Halomonas sp. FL8]MCP1362524.1 hypothetical protein [Halomonas sp. BBD45]